MQPLRLVWAGGEHDFDLSAIGSLRALQAAADAGPITVMNRVMSGEWYVDDIVATLRLGLIGAGMERGEAQKVVDRTFAATPTVRLVMPAQAVLIHALVGAPVDGADADPDEGDAAGKTTGASPPKNGTFAASTGSAP